MRSRSSGKCATNDELTIYLDTNVVVSLFTDDVFTPRAEAFFQARRGPFTISDLLAVEFSAVIARQVRTHLRHRTEALAILTEFDAWCSDSTERIPLTSEHFALAESHLRGLHLALSTPDALHIAVTQRIDAELATFDEQVATAARRLGLTLADA
jgi:uncharacterized protein